MKIIKQLTPKMQKMFSDDLRFTKGASHCHTHNSVDDATSTEKDVCAVAIEYGADAAFISDHGTAMGWDDFDEAAKKAGIKPIFGIEAYYLDDVTQAKSHLCLYAKNDEGLRQLNKAMARGVILDDGRTCFTDETLELLRGGNIIATSACIQGVLGSIVLYNNRLNERIAKLNAEIDEFAESIELYEKSKVDFEQADHEWTVLKAEVSEAKAASKKSFAGKQKQLDGMKKKLDKAIAAFDKYLVDGLDKTAKSVCTALAQLEVNVESPDEFEAGIDAATNKYNQRVAQVKAEADSMQELASTLDEKTLKMEQAKIRRTDAKEALDSVAKVIVKIENKKAKIEEYESQKLSKEVSQELFQRRLATMLDVFGKDFYMEVQNHGLDLELTIYPWIAKTAKKHNIPLIAANDAHVARNLPGSFKARQIRRSCRFSKWEEETDDLIEYYIKNDRELALALYQILPEDAVIDAMSNVSKVVEQCNAQIVKESHAPKAKVANVKEEMIRLARANITKKYGDEWGQKHEDRFNYEIDIIDSMGFSDYFYITWDILDVARKIGGLSYEKLDELKAQMTNMSLEELLEYLDKYNTEPNLSVGLGRGSGAGSIVCYLLGITNIDPFKYDLLFERFLNPERISMPDIDSDFRSDIKDVLTIYLKRKYGDRAIAQILTKSMLQGRSAIDKVVMILGSRDGVDYRYIADKLKKKTGVDFKKSMEENRKALMAGADSAIEKEIVETAILMDGNLDHTGLHAAGVIISDNDDLSEYIPVAWDAGFETWKTLCDMVQCENKHGLLKMDLLLLTTLDIITYTLRLIKKTHPDVEIDIENLPMEEEVFKSIYATGDTKAVFQFESGGMVKFLRQMQPTCIEDIIAANAMYRPGPMDSIPDYIEAKFSGNVQYMCPELEPILSNTYGQIIYQEQVMAIFRELAGYSLGRSDLVRRAMAKKHLDELVAEREYFINGSAKYDAEHPDAPLNIRGCVPSGISAEVANKMFDRMLAFAAYAFNKSHAAAYSATSYMTAWLKHYYPTEFFCAALNYTGAQKEIPSIVADAKRHGIQVLRPDINKSEFNFSVEGKNIRFGLSFLANAKTRANAVIDGREGGFKTFKEFIKIRPGKSLAESCILAGACDSYIANNPDKRLALLEAYTELSAMYDKIVAAEARLETEMKSDAKIKAEATLNELIRKWDEYQLPKVQPMTLIQRLNEEQKYTSIYFSGNPMDSFDVQSGDYVDIANLEEGKNVWIAAAISEERMLKTKKDSLPMMSGKFTDASGSVDFIIFPKTYAQVVDSLTTVMAFNGRLTQNNDEEPQFVVSSVKALPQKNKKIVVWFDDYKATQAIVKSGAVDRTTGYPAFLVGKNSKMYATGVHITEEYAIENNLKYKITT